MILRVRPAILLLSGGLAVAGCSTPSIEGPRMGEGAGTVLGATGGALAGGEIGAGYGNVAATGAGALVGGLVGYQLGHLLYTGPRATLSTPTDFTLQNLPSNRPMPWRNPDAAAPLGNAAANCREYQQTIIVGGEKRPGYGTACQQPDGSWKIVR